MKCNRYSLLQFTCGELDVEEMERITAHLEQCTECSAELRLIARLRANREELCRALAEKPAGSKSFHLLPGVFRKGWTPLVRENPYPWIAAASILVTVGTLLFFLIHTPTVQDLAALATAGLPPYEPMILRQGGSPGSPLFLSAMESYRKSDLIAARSKLEQLLQDNPKDAEALFYLGVIHYHGGEYSKAEYMIRDGLSSCTYGVKEKYHWFLAQIALKRQQKEKARQELNRVTEFQGRYAAEAQQILSRLP